MGLKLMVFGFMSLYNSMSLFFEFKGVFVYAYIAGVWPMWLSAYVS